MMVAHRICLVCVIVLFVGRVPGVFSSYEAIRDDHFTAEWDPSVNEAARFAATLPPGGIFIAADWGVATQVFCLSNGRQNFVFEPFWHYEGRESMAQILDPPERQLALIAAPRPRSPVAVGVTDRIFDDVRTSRDWVETPVDERIASLRSVEIRAFRRTQR
jgi:hypothetical protein